MFTISLSLFAATHCANGGNTGDSIISGSYAETTTILHKISTSTWNITYPGMGTCIRYLMETNNTENYMYFAEEGSICANSGKYGKVFYQRAASGQVSFCDFVAGKASLPEAKDLTGKPDTSCNGKAWTQLNPINADLTLVGTFSDNFGGGQLFSNTLWTTSGFGTCTFAVIYYDNANGYFIYQQQADAGCFATNNYKFGKVYWTVDSSSKLYYCELLYGQSSYLTTANSTARPTYSNPASAGCNGFSWTQITRQ